MQPEMLATGPVRSPYGRVDAVLLSDRLELRHHGSWLDFVDRFKLVILAAAFVLALSSGLADGVLQVVLLGAAGALFLLLVVLVLAEAVMTVVAVGYGVVSLLTPSGRARLKRDFRTVRGRAADSAEGVVRRRDVRLVAPVEGSLRPRLVLTTVDGQMVLSGWLWRRHGLERLAAALGQSSAPL